MKSSTSRTITSAIAALLFGALAVTGVAVAGPASAEAPAMAMGSIYQTISVKGQTTSTRPVLKEQNAVANQQALNELGGWGVVG